MELVSLMKVKGFGPASLRKINKQLRIDTIEQLKQALIDGKVSNLKSFGKKKVDAMIIALQLLEQTKNRILLHDAMEMSDVILQSVKKLPQIKKAQIAGSLRRKKETIGDLDLLICCDSKFNKEVAAFFSTSGIARKVLAIGSKKVSVLLKDYNCQLDVRIVKESDWAATLLYFTGSKEHTIQLRKIAHKKGFKLSEYGLFNLQNGQKLDCLTEASIYKSLGINYIAPELREGRGEIEFAQDRKMPDLVNMGQIRGDMHLHSNWSDGSESIENIANYLIKNFNYDYMVLTDHSR
jgi:DNA polymerase (family 10)